MTRPGDEMAAGAGGHRHLRASYADREQAIDELKAAFVHGRLNRDEFGLRVGRALESRTCAELTALTADLPPRLVTFPRPVEAVRVRKAIAQCRRAVTDQERMYGRDHPGTIAAHASLASALRSAGKLKDAIAQYERVLADRERVEGADHPDTIAARANLAYAYRIAKRFRDAIPQYERTLDDRIRVQGPDHPDTLAARSNLAACYQQACRLTEAIPQYKRALADSERMLGAGDTETLITRCNLASAYYTAAAHRGRRGLAESSHRLRAVSRSGSSDDPNGASEPGRRRPDLTPLAQATRRVRHRSKRPASRWRLTACRRAT